MFFLFGCNSAPDPVIFGAEFCDHCLMGIHDHRYGGAILSEKGKTYKFDSLECLEKFEVEKMDKGEKVKGRYAFNTFKKGELIKLEEAFFLNNPALRSPMGLGIWAFDSSETASKAAREAGVEVLKWMELKTLLNSK